MIKIRQNTALGLRNASRIPLLCAIFASFAIAAEPRPAKVAIVERTNTRFVHLMTTAGLRGQPGGRAASPPRQHQNIHAQGGRARVKDLRFTHLTTNDGLSQGYVAAILQDRRGFMWFATRDGLNRYDGNSFVVYKNNPNDPSSLSSDFLQDLTEDDHGDLWIATNAGVNKFDPTTERFTHYLPDPENADSIGGAAVRSVAQDSRGYLWFGTEDSGLDEFDPRTQTFTHYRNDSDGGFVGRITQVISDKRRNIWFVGERGLFHLNPQTGQITRPLATRNGFSADSVYEDEAGNLWMLASAPIVGLVKYDPQRERLTRYPLDTRAVSVLPSTINGGSANGRLLADGRNGLWVPSSLGLSYFDREKERFTYRFRHDDTDPYSLDSNAIMSVYRDRSGVLWVGTENTGVNVLNPWEEQFLRYRHDPGDPSSISPGRVKAIYEDPNGVLWLGFFPRALDRLDRETGKLTHYLASGDDQITLGVGTDVNSIYRDAAGYLWVGGGGCGLVRFNERTGRFQHYRHKPDDPNSLISDNVYTIYGDRNGQMWVGQEGGVSRFDPATDGFTNYRPLPDIPGSTFENTFWSIYQDRSGTMWLGTWGGALVRVDDKAKPFVTYTPDPRDPHRFKGGGINAVHEDRTGTLWVGAFDGLYRFDRQSGAMSRYTESEGLPTSTIRCILEDRRGWLWLSTQRGLSRFDPQTGAFRNYDVSDGLQTNEFSTGCYQGSDGEMFFGGSNGFNAFFPEKIADDPYVPPVVITSLKLFNKPVPVGAKSVLKRAIPYTDSLTLSYRDNIFSFEFAALSYANSQKNRYRYKLEPLESVWNEVGSKQRLATYTNLDPGKYAFRVQGSNSDGVWNQQGVSLSIIITPPWWKTSWFRLFCAILFAALVWAAYRFRVHRLQRESKQLRGVIETIPAMAWTALPDGSNEFVNRRWLEYTGLSQEETAGSGWQAAVHPEDIARHAERWRASLTAGQVFEDEVRFRRAADGEYRWFLVRGVPLWDGHGNILKWYGIIADIEDRKRAEEERQRLRQLEADLAHINRVSMLGEMGASIAHEVKQPLAGVVSNATAGLRWLAGDVPNLEEAREGLRRIVRDGKRAGEVIDRIRALTKGAATPREKLDLNETIREVLALVGDEAKRRSVSTRMHFAQDLTPILGDRVQLQQVLLNLLINAIEAMSSVSDRARELVITTRSIDPDQVQVTVEDSGIGIEVEKMDKIFDSFYTTKPGGMGMGLSISRSILQAHGGRLWATAKGGSGTTFHFTLPNYREEGSHAGVA